jgi:hypothetical protein
MIWFTLPKWLTPKPASAGVSVKELPDTVDDLPDEPLVLEASYPVVDPRPPTVSAWVRAIVEASVDRVYDFARAPRWHGQKPKAV